MRKVYFLLKFRVRHVLPHTKIRAWPLRILTQVVPRTVFNTFFISDEPLEEKEEKNAHLHEVVRPSNQRTNQRTVSIGGSTAFSLQKTIYVDGWC